MRMPAVITLFVFCSLIQCTTCTCNITCTSDYISSLNCSCSGPRLAFYYSIAAECWEEGDEDDRISASCEIKAPRRWCILELDPDEFPIGAFSTCTVQVQNSNGAFGAEQNDSTTLKLFEKIKLQPPFDISLTMCNSSYNVSWKMAYTEDNSYLSGYLIYRVRARIKGETKPSYYFIYEDRRYLEIPFSVLERGKDYEVDVQARITPHKFKTGFWSEWSSTVKWKTKDDNGKDERKAGGNDSRRYCFLLLILAPCLLCFCATRRLWLRKVHVYIPSPENFFRPLYHSYEGDFKKWVGPTFTLSASDCLEGNMAVPVVKGKQEKSLERLSKGEGEDSTSLTDSAVSQNSSNQSPEHGGCSQGLDSSVGHISIHTVTVLEDESQSSGRSRDARGGSRQGHFAYPPFCPGGSSDSEVLGLLAARCRWDGVISGGRVSRGAGSSGDLSSRPALDCLEPGQRSSADEPDQSSLESFSFSERSEDGYPAVALDMDTIDSGFLESDCSSPAHSDPDSREKTDTPVLAESFHTNYVKQWVATADPSAP